VVVVGATIALGGYSVPAALLGLVVLPGAVLAREVGGMVRAAALATVPLAVAVLLVSVLARPGATVLFRLGPFDATLEGLDFALGISWRLFVSAAALALFARTTPPRSLVADLERRGVSPRLTFAAAASLQAVPFLVERGRNVRDAQRARGLDVDGSIGARLRGVLPLAGPVVLGAIHGVEARSLALEARGFARPGRRHPLWAPLDTGRERLARWLLIVGLVAVVAARATGLLQALP
jgi:energy-coupling factor transport system permease protein